MKTKIIIIFVLFVTLIACNTKENNEPEEQEEHGPEGVVTLNENQQEALNLQLGGFEMRNLTTVVKTNGQLEVPPASTADITAIIGGNVKYIKVFHGDKIKKGQLLAVLEHPDYVTLQEEFAEIANNLEFLEQEFKRQKELFENNVGAGKDYQKAKSEYNTAKAKYEGLKSRLLMLHLSPEKVKQGRISNTINILSPINGYVNEVNIKVGTYVDAKDQLIEITDNSAIHAGFKIYEKDVHLVKKGQIVHFTVSNRPNEELTATVFAIGKEFEPNTRSIQIHSSLNKEIPDLIPGMYITGHLHTDENLTRTLPNDAVVSEGTKSYIFVLDESIHVDEHDHEHENGEEEEEEEDHESSKTFKMVEVITGQKDDGYTEIKLINPLPDSVKIVLNAAYYLLADMKKEETEHDH